MAGSWENMLDEFRALGGTADNICVREGRFGRGLFPCDSSKPVRMHVPESLLIEAKYIRFDGDEFRLHNDAPVGTRERVFLEAYQREFSWGACRGETEALLRTMAEAPQELRELLDTPFDAELWLSGPTQAAIRERHFGARAIKHKERVVVMPVIELANHGHTPISYSHGDGISVSGTFEDEILVSYCLTDALDIFNNWGFASEGQPFALGLKMNLETQLGEIIIERGDIVMDSKRRLFYPDVKIEGRRITLSYMMLGHKNFPRLAKANFYRIMRDAGRGDFEETFDRIAQINRSQFLKLIALSEHAPHAVGKLVRDIARIQLEAMSHAVGTREL